MAIYFLVTLANEHVNSQVIDAPCFAGKLLEDFPGRIEVLKFNMENTEYLVRKGDKPWNSIGMPFVEWVKPILNGNVDEDQMNNCLGDAD